MMVGRHPMAEANEESPFRSLSASEFYKQHSMAHSFVSANDMASRSSRSGGRPSRWSTHVGSSSSPTNDRSIVLFPNVVACWTNRAQCYKKSDLLIGPLYGGALFSGERQEYADGIKEPEKVAKQLRTHLTKGVHLAIREDEDVAGILLQS